MSEEKRAQVYSTFEVARLCGVFHTTVLHWIRKGKLRAYATPGGHHRITRSALVEFMERYEFPVPRGWEPSPTRVLIVDDDPAVGAAIRSALARAADPYEVAAVADPVRGLVEIGRCPPDLLVLDLLLPVVDGYEICRILKASPFTQGIRILAITGGSPSRAQAAFLAEHADALLAKPFDPRKLTAAVRKLLD